MKRIIFSILAALVIMSAQAQTTGSKSGGMSDEEVLAFVIKERQAGTDNAQIVTKLMQNGVDIAQIRRVKEKYQNGSGSSKMIGEANIDRSRTNNGTGAGVGSGTVKKEDPASRVNMPDGMDYYQLNMFGHNSATSLGSYDTSSDYEKMLVTQSLDEFEVDSMTMLRTMLAEQKKKKVFGRDIFNNSEMTFEPNMNIATPQDYRLGPGDAVFIEIYGASQRTIEGTVSPDGEVTIEGFGPVQLSGLTVSQANSKLRSTLGSRYQNSRINLTVGQTRTIMVNVMGEVNYPGTYTLSAFASVFHALYMAGGINDIGTLRNIKVYRNNRLVSTVDIYDYMLNGKLSGNIKLADNDVITVGTYDCLVSVEGNVKRTMYNEMKKNESVYTLLKYAGGFTGDAYTKSVRVFRKSGREYSIFNVEEFDMNAFYLFDEDNVKVDKIIPRYSNMVELRGAVFRPGMYQVGGNINSVRTLLEVADGVREEAFTEHAVMHRMKTDRSLEVIAVDVEGIMNGTVADIPLKPNDVLFIPTKSELYIKKFVSVLGEVLRPGNYKYADNMTLEDLILQAGGLSEAASTVKVDVARRIVDPDALTTDSIIAKTYSLALKDGFVIDGQAGFVLEPFDRIYVRKSPGTISMINVTVEGEVAFAGSYTLPLRQTRLSDIIKAAGGPNDRAYIKGARLERQMTNEERLRMEAAVTALSKQSEVFSDTASARKALDTATSYYVGLELDKALANPGGEDDILLRSGDKIIVPQYTETVKVNGEVMYPNTVGYVKGKGVRYYIDQAGGFGQRAKKSHTIVIYMNGKVAKVGHNAKVMPGCEIVVPSKPKKDPAAITQWLSIGTSMATIATMIATLANILK
ncbi:MAG: SLBB domain-containing protein [Prevotella sp.]|nr:SLBB domain-containing protein [Prevotella sp.]